jgi:tRNA(Ile)-lysidine synthase
MAQSVLGFIRKHDLLRPGDRVGSAVSGGADSVALLRLLIELRFELGVVLSVVHLNHRLRGAESDQDEQFVLELAATHGLQTITDSCDVKANAAEKKLSLETAARRLRYQFFERQLHTQELDKIATAHTIDDQAETVLLKFARGAGTRGLAGIYPRVAIRPLDSAQAMLSPSPFSRTSTESSSGIVRPLLSTSRKDIEAYLTEIGQSWREDSSNRDLRHTRNRVRHGIIPRLEKQVNPAVRQTLAEAADIARVEEEYWMETVAQLMSKLWMRTKSENESGGVLQRNDVAGLSRALQRRIIRAAAESLGLNLEFQHVEDVLALKDGGCRVLSDTWTVSRHKGKLEFLPARMHSLNYEYPLPVPGRVFVPEAGLVLETLILGDAAGFQSASNLSRSDQLLDSNLCQRLIVRNWRPGERFWPIHTKEPKKLKELLQDRHITGEEKKRWPVVASGDEVVWVRGLGVRRDMLAKGNAGVLIRECPDPGNPE